MPQSELLSKVLLVKSVPHQVRIYCPNLLANEEKKVFCPDSLIYGYDIEEAAPDTWRGTP